MASDLANMCELKAWNILHALDLLCKNNVTCSEELRTYLAKQIWNIQDRQSILSKLSRLLLKPGCAVDVGLCFRPLMLDIASRARGMVLAEGHANLRLQRKLALALGMVLPVCPELERFTGDFISVFKPFTNNNDSEEPKKKKSKKEKIGSSEWCRALHNLATHMREPSRTICISMVADYMKDPDLSVRWYAVQTYCSLTGMAEQTRCPFLRQYFTPQEEQDMLHRSYQETVQREQRMNAALGAVALEILESAQTHTQHQLLPSDLDSGVVSVTGIVLPRLPSSSDKESASASSLSSSSSSGDVKHQWVSVPSMQDSLHSLALAVSGGRPVLVQGPVGCGKTLLIQHLAGLTGRSSTPHIIKVQLGDQTDSKALLGTYQCTEVPGQFVWRPGVLTEAVTKGHWLLLEDLDHAPMEVVSLLAPLLHTSTLSVPGHGDLIQAAPGFQLFATQRLFASGDGLHSQNKSSAVLDKLWTQVTIQPLSRAELKQVVVTRFPNLPSVVDRLLDIYFMLSAGRHHLTSDPSDLEGESEGQGLSEEENTVGKFLSLTGRLISTRDLMSWCSRVSSVFEPTSASSAELILQAAVDCFVACLPCPTRRLALTKAIATHLSLAETTADYFLSKRLPQVDEECRHFTVGNVTLARKQENIVTVQRRSKGTFSYTRPAVCLLEKVASCVYRNEPVLLVGETGTGKTSSVQFLAHTLGHKLHVINLNQQSDSVDLLGGFKPVDLKFLMMPLREDFERLFCKTFSRKQNASFLHHLQNCFTQKRWHDMLALMEHSWQGAATLMVKKEQQDEENREKWRKQGRRWNRVGARIKKLKAQVQETENVLAFSFIEGTLVKALKAGDWVLLDEINLATAETLQCLAGLLESTDGSLVLTDRGTMDPVVRHADFRLFACMNPATDVGKKDLTPGVRNRFTELYVDELTEAEDLRLLVGDYLRSLSLSAAQLKGMVKFYTDIRHQAATRLVDGTGHKPHYSLRTLCRALRFVQSHNCGTVARSLYEGFCLSFLTQLDRTSHPVVTSLICQHVLGGKVHRDSPSLRQPLPQPKSKSGGATSHLQFCGYWISQGGLEPTVPEHYILTASVKDNLKDLARVVSAGSHPVLLQGETSVGKTSLITWLARSSGNRCLRVNNHEHTDLQEYVGCYAADESGKLVFKEGVLVEAMRKGYWIILDELNLAPTDVLEALNRLLDDNQELFIPETQEMVKAHPKFMLFATQNPPGHYGGRKMLSRAFRNRFVELHFDEIPKGELETILHQRCGIPLSYAKRLVAVMMDLQVRRQQTGLFAGKQSWMTLRDLFRWAERYNSPLVEDKNAKFYNYDQHMADHGYMLLAGRVRKPEEVSVIQEVIEKHFKQCTVNAQRLFDLSPLTSPTVRAVLQTVVGGGRKEESLSSSCACGVEGFEHVVWTGAMRRLAVLIGQAIQFGEPVLLVGDTGCGKTTVCQLYAALRGKGLHSVNCHLHTESADFLGGLRPVRSHSQEEGEKQKLFEWVDGPLVTAMKEGSMFLIDEISLADDSVLERLNSVLEPERSILLAEKGGGESADGEVEVVKAGEGFQVFATMNPGGDFGKKELSPALRNRFTEIWCPQSSRRDDLVSIIEHNVRPGLTLVSSEATQSSSESSSAQSGFGSLIMDFVSWFSSTDIGKRCTVSIRDILTWVHFLNTCTKGQGQETGDQGQGEGQGLDPAVAYIHGACLVFLDSLGAGVTSRGSDHDTGLARAACLAFLQDQLRAATGSGVDHKMLGLADQSCGGGGGGVTVDLSPSHLSIFPFSLAREASDKTDTEQYAMQAPTTCVNAQRIIRGLQLSRPLLLEGAPGVGKTSLVAAVARLAGRPLVRINLSEQTDVTDLFGADLPVEGGTGGSFAWRDGPFLQALKAGHWVVFDEMNLASQSVLEGLNACLDHRGEVYVPELARTFRIQHQRTRIFACQNPLNQGGGRKGLPRSFLNRFTQVYVEPLSRHDLIFICTTMYPSMPQAILTKMVDFNMRMHEETMVRSAWGHKGAPWEFNLRDINRWCDLLLANQANSELDPGEYVGLVYQDRMRTADDKQRVAQLFTETFGQDSTFYQPSRVLRVGAHHVQAGNAFLQRKDNCSVGGGGEDEGKEGGGGGGGTMVLHHSLAPLESLMTCVNMGWMAVLVGSSSSGKSSLVRLLSELSGHPLDVLPMTTAMDTTELLGGFEQADIGRHVAELTGEVMQEVRAYQREHSLSAAKGALGVVASLDQELLALRAECEEDADEDSSKEKEALLNRVQKLQRLVAKLTRLHHSPERLSELTKSLRREQETLERVEDSAGSVGGGAFEWVDSLLVKALRHGHWLLIDNVNFCSPSVLDRLNALLEPRGVLTINERGVTPDGTVPTITPHPDFRLFLSMDPKFGEISRAMRNRGVEIFILGESDGSPYDAHDTLSMLQGVGLRSKLACDWLMRLHTQLTDRLSTNERPGLCEVVRCAVQARQQQEKGVGVAGALSHAAHSVYVRNVKSLANRQVVCSILSERLSELKEEMAKTKTSSSSDSWVDWAVVAPSVGQFQNHSGLASAQQAARVFVSLLSTDGLADMFTQNNDADADNDSDPSTDVAHQYLRQLQTALSIFLSHQNTRSWTLAWQWLTTCVQQRKGHAMASLTISAEDRERVDAGLARLMDSGQAFLQCVLGPESYVNRFLKHVCQDDSLASRVLLSDTAWDYGTNPQLMKKMVEAAKQQELWALVYRLELSLELRLVTEPMKEDLALLDKLCTKAQRRRTQSSKVLRELGELLQGVITHLPSLVDNMSEESVQILYRGQDGLLWLSRLLAEAVSSEGRGEVEEVYLSQLALHWTWCWTLCLSHLITQDSAPALRAAVTMMQSLLGDDSSASLVKAFITFWSSWRRPPAFATETAANRWQELGRLATAIGVDGNTAMEAARQKLKVLGTREGSVTPRKLAFIARRMLSGDLDVEADLASVREFLLSHRLLRSDMTTTAAVSVHQPASASVPDSTTDQACEDMTSASVPLWPVYEFLGLQAALTAVLSGRASGGGSDGGGVVEERERRQRVLDFDMRCSPSALCLHVNKEQDLTKGERMRWLLHLLRRLWTSPSVTQCAHWLTWDTQPSSTDDAQPLSLEVPGPAVFHRSSLLQYASHLLVSPHSHGHGLVTSQYDLLPLNVTLGHVHSQLRRLSNFTRCLWKHCGLLSSDAVSLRRSEENLLTHMFVSLLRSLTSLLDSETRQQQWSALVDSLDIVPKIQGASVLHCWSLDQEAVSSCLTQLQDILMQAGITESTESDSSLPSTLHQCFKLVQEAVASHSSSSSSSSSSSAGVGCALVYVGMALLGLLAPRGPVDPVHKASIELSHYRKELRDVETDVRVWARHLQLTRGQGVEEVSPALTHPRLAFLLRRRCQLLSLIAQLEKQHAFRGDRTQYLHLVREVETVMATTGSASTCGGLVTRLRSSCQADKAEFCALATATTTALREEQTWQTALGRFSRRLGEEFPCLPDLTVPVCVAVEQMRLGMRVLSQEASLRLKQVQKQYWPGSGHLDAVVSKLSSFPSVRPLTPTWLHLASVLSSPATKQAVECLLTAEDQEKPATAGERVLPRLLSCSLQLVKNHAQQTGELTPDLFATFSNVLDLFVKAWQDQEDRRRAKEEEEASLYRFKDQTHGDNKTLEEKEEQAFRQAFPSFHDYFADMVEATRLEDTGDKPTPMEMDVNGSGDDQSDAPDTVSEQEMDEVCTHHLHMLRQLTWSAWLPRQQSSGEAVTTTTTAWDVVKPALLAYQVASDVGRQSWHLLREQVDRESLGSHLMVCGTLAHSLQALDDSDAPAEAQVRQLLRPPPPRCYNVYVDPNVGEVMQCRSALTHLVSRVRELQRDWPANPVLSQLLQLVERIESFPVTSPVIKFLTGMELLLEKAQHWERNAASHVSLSTQLSEVTAIIVRWRKLELRCWSGALDIEVERCRRKASRWWFHLYTLTTTHLALPQSEEEDVRLVQSLKQFMEGSTVGEFTVRHDIMMAFHCHLIHTPPSPQRDRLLPLLWNLHQFYGQFRPAVVEEIARLRAPIEKDLKGFVKIARWSEMNYWALKESTEKTHRTVHKHARAFQGLLNEPVRGLLGEKQTILQPEENLRSSGSSSSSPLPFCQRIMNYHQHCLKAAGQSCSVGEEDIEPLLERLTGCNSLQRKLPTLCQRASKHWTRCLQRSSVCDHIAALDDLTGDLIQEAHELQKLDIPQGTDKDKQKSEARHIHQRKRKALADSFKQLTALGLSFKKGLLKEKEKANHVDEALFSTPLNPAACLDKGSGLHSLWEGCDVYFTRCLSRLAQFSVALQSPSKELGMDNIQRCQGFAEHLTVMVMTQRQQLADAFSHFMAFRKLTSAVERLKGQSLAPQQEMLHWLESTKREVTQLAQGLTQFGLLLQACPPPPSSSSSLNPLSNDDPGVPLSSSPFPPDSLGPMARLMPGDDLWTKCWASVQAYLETAGKLQTSLLGLTERMLFTGEDINTLFRSVVQLQDIANGLQEMTTTLNHHHNDNTNTNSLTSSLVFLTTSIHNFYNNFHTWRQTLNKTHHHHKTVQIAQTSSSGVEEENVVVADFSGKLEGLVESVLLCVQKLVKSSKEVEEEERKKRRRAGEEGDDGGEEEDVGDCHLVSLMEQVQKQVSFLEVEKLSTSLEHLCEHLKDLTNNTAESKMATASAAACGRLLVHCGPVLQVYAGVVESHMGRSLALHRTMGKMLSVMLGVFTQLALKGFCLPAEYTEEAGGEGATDFVDIEGGGIGEGEGAKDVSEQIEGEDQLDETKLAGEEKEKSEDQQPDVAPEENAIEMSEDFDAKPQDLEPVEGDNEEDDDDDKGEEDAEKQMGEVDGPDQDKLDDQMWGSDEEDDDKDDEGKAPKEDEGPGEGPQGDKEELKAKDDSLQKNQGEDEETNDDKQDNKDKEEEENKPQDLQDFDENEYDDNRIDPHHGENEKEEEPENMDLPEDLNLDQDEKDDGEDGGEGPPAEEEGEERTDLPPDVTEEENEGAEKDGQEGEEEDKEEKEDGQEKEGGAEEENKDNAREEDGEEAMEEDESPEEEKGEGGDEEETKKHQEQEEKGGEEEEEPGAESKGFNPQEKKEGEEEKEEEEEGREVEERQHRGQSKEDTAGAEDNEDAENNAVGDNDQEEKEGVGQTTTDQQDGHEGSTSTQLTAGVAPQHRKQSQRKPGESKEDRSLGSAEEKFRRLKTTERSENAPQPEQQDRTDREAEMYEHIKEDTSHADAQTLDVATDQQQKQQAVVGKPEEEEEGADDDDDDVKMREEDKEEKDEQKEKTVRERSKHPQNREAGGAAGEEQDGEKPMDQEKAEVEGSVVQTLDVERPSMSTIHTQLDHLHLGATMSEADVDALRSQLESTMTTWTQADLSDHQQVAAAVQAWQHYEALTSSLSQELCEQLRLVLEPSQATKLRGDYRTGKRLNMRKVIPYIASQFRKDKIWLRRTKPSKRQYQIMLAIDDSSSMADNHSKQLAFESLALTANALTLLETGELGVCSFGETVKLLHPFTEPFSNQAGANILQQFTFEQKQTRVALMLEQVTGVMLEARSRQQGWMGRPETAQLLVIVSDGRGINSEGMGVVRQAVRKAREANVFVVFVILDDPKNKNSILDIRITTFNQGKPVFLSYMEEFPFPFYVILRDINSLPQVLSDALRQWFELVTASAT